MTAGADYLAFAHLVTEIQRATHVLGLHLESTLADLEVSQGEIHVLSLLAGPGSMTVGELQHGVRHRPSTLTGILDRLSSKGMVRRVINDADRRSFRIELTRAGRAAARRVTRVMSAIEKDISKERSAHDIEVMRTLLRRIADRFQVGPARTPREGGDAPRAGARHPRGALRTT